MYKFIVLRGSNDEMDYPQTKNIYIIQASSLPAELIEKYPDVLFSSPVLNESGDISEINICYMLLTTDYVGTGIRETFNSKDGKSVFAVI